MTKKNLQQESTRQTILSFTVTVVILGAMTAFLLGGAPSSSSNVHNRVINETLSASMGFNDGRNIPECHASFCEIEQVNREILYPLLQKVVVNSFFSHFKIDLCSSCELWEDAPLCRMKDCSVCECNDPPIWSSDGVEEFPETGPNCDSIADDYVVTTVDSSVRDTWAQKHDHNFLLEGKNTFLSNNNQDDTISSSSTAQVVDLILNPEGYTGYVGPSAEKVWSEIHSINCFQPLSLSEHVEKDNNNDKNCLLSSEQRVYNRFISGLHSSISLHIAHSYCLQMDPNKVGECYMWGLNDTVAYDRVLRYPDRVENLYVAFTLLLRAVIKAEYAITAAVPHSDPALVDSLSYWKDSLLPELISIPQKISHDILLFDESALLNDENFHPSKRTELQRRFQHLTDIMQCVGCDRCKLWGTLQTLGIGTALRILFYENDESINLSRQEAVALINTLERLSSSLIFANEFRKRREKMELWKGNNNDNDKSNYDKLICSSTDL